MTDNINQTPEQIARDKIDKMLIDAEWVVQSRKNVDLLANKGVAIREYQTDVGPADYVLFVDRKPVGIIEAKREDEGYRLTVVEDQSKGYAESKLKYLDNDPLPFVYESTGTITRITDYRVEKMNKVVLRQIWGCFNLIEIKSPFSAIDRSSPYHTFAA